MKKRYLYLLVLALLFIFMFILFQKGHKIGVDRNVVKSEPESSNVTETGQSSQANSQIDRSSNSNASVTKNDSSFQTIMQRYMENRKKDPVYDWKQPINFYGKVLDESNQPVAGVSVHFSWTDLSQNGTSEADATTDANGMFALEGKTGKRLCLWAEKEGYYTANDARVPCYEYANPGDGLFTPDSNNPVVLHLRKKREGVDLITSEQGMSPVFQIHIPRDGTPIKIDLMQHKTGEMGQIQFSELKPEYGHWQQATQWSFKIEIPDGGLVGENEEFPFEAPEAGYNPSVEFRFNKNENWVTALKTNFYIQFGNPPLYGRLQVETGISYGGANLTYAINPTGSRNLESK